MPITLTTLMLAPGAQIEGRRAGAFAGAARSMAVAGDVLYVLFQTPEQADGELHNLMSIDLLTGEGRVEARDMAAALLLGFVDGARVDGLDLKDWRGISAWVDSRSARLDDMDLLHVTQRLQTADELLLCDGSSGVSIVRRLCVERNAIRAHREPPAYPFDERVRLIEDYAYLQRRLPTDCESLACATRQLIRMGAKFRLRGSSPDGDYAATADIHYPSTSKNLIHARTGAVLWIEQGNLRMMRGFLRPSQAWSPAAHRLYAPAERARALVLLLCAHLPRRLLHYMIARAVDAA